MLTLTGESWAVVKQTDAAAAALFRRHYSGRADADYMASGVVGPGSTLVLLTPADDALIAWRWFDFAHTPRCAYRGLHLVIYRNESPRRSSDLLLEAEPFAWRKWADERLMRTFVDPRAVASKNPGYCFKCAGWRYVGTTKSRGLHVLEKYRQDAPVGGVVDVRA